MHDSPSTILAHLRTALNTGDRLPLRQVLHPDVQWASPTGDGGGCLGRTEVLTRCSQLHEQGLRVTVEESFAYPGAVVLGLLVHEQADRQTPAAPLYQVFHLADGLITRIRGYWERYDALQAAYAGPAVTRTARDGTQ